MRTATVEPGNAVKVAMHWAAAGPRRADTLPPVPPASTRVPGPVTSAAEAAAAEPARQSAREAELDAMLRVDPNTGAIGGLRVALLFNAGLALSGLLAWELWALLS